MADSKEFIQRLLDKKGQLVEELRQVYTEAESRSEGYTAEDKQKIERLEADLKRVSDGIDTGMRQAEMNKKDAEQREQFKKMLTTETAEAKKGRDLEQRINSFMRAALPDAEVWAPRTIDVPLIERRDLTKGVATAGGDLVPTGFVRTLMDFLEEMAAVRNLEPNLLRTSSGEDLQLPKVTGHGAAAIVGEGAAIPENDPAFSQVTLGAFKYGTLIEVSRELIEDNAVDLPSFLARNAGLQIGQANGADLVTGAGVTTPEGIANNAVAGKVGATGQTISVTGEDLIDLFHSVVSGYRARGWWAMNDLTAAEIRKIREDTTGNFLWQPGLQAGQPDRLLGRPVVTDPNIAEMAANAFSIAFGDFGRYYTIRDASPVRFERSDDFRFANDLVAFRVLFRTDARQVINGADSAVKWYQNSAT